MKKQKTQQTIICPRCSTAIDGAVSVCPVCGTILLKEPQKKKGKAKKILSAAAGALFSLSAALLIIMLFVYSASANVAGQTGFWGSWAAVAAPSAAAVILAVAIFAINIRSLRSAFLVLGISLAVAVLLCFAASIASPFVIELLSGELHDIFAVSASALNEYLVVIGSLMIIPAATFVSVYLTIRAIKGGNK